MNRVQWLLACAAVALLTWPAAAQQAGRGADDNPFDDGAQSRSRRRVQQAQSEAEERLVVRFYDVSDLIGSAGVVPRTTRGRPEQGQAHAFLRRM